jgi:hypothetical protein
MEAVIQSISDYLLSPSGQWLVACFALAVFNQALLVRYLIWIIRKGRLGLWQLRGPFAAFGIAASMLVSDLGHADDLGFAMVVVFCIDLFFLGAGILPADESSDHQQK